MLSVVIPTRDRKAVLLETLRALDGQHLPDGGVEVVVVDNGSTDGTAAAVSGFAAGSAIPLRLVSEPGRGPARARNTGVATASGELILFLGDDTAPERNDLLARHVDLHAARPDWRYAIQGRIVWTRRRQITPLMAWLDRSGFQFDFGPLEAGSIPAVGAFYTAHVSLKRRLFDEAGRFDTRFPWAAIEDIELSVRLERAGIELDYHPELLVLHDHPTTLEDSLARQNRVGRSAALLHRIQPDFDDPRLAKPHGARWQLVEWTGPVSRTLSRLPLPGRTRDRALKAAHLSAYARGYRQGPPALDGSPPAGERSGVR